MDPIVFLALFEFAEPASSAEQALFSVSAPVAIVEEVSLRPDPFGPLATLETDALSQASGGSAHYAVDIEGVGVNIATADAGINDSDIRTNGNTGRIDGTVVTDNAGITTVFVNSGNGVVFQNTTQINVYTANN